MKSGFHPGLGVLRSLTCSTELSPYQLSGALSEGHCSPLGLPLWVKWLGSVNLVAYRKLLHLEQLRDLLSNCCLQVRGTLAPGFPTVATILPHHLSLSGKRGGPASILKVFHISHSFLKLALSQLLPGWDVQMILF